VRHNNGLTPVQNILLASFKDRDPSQKKGRTMLVNWKKDVDAALADAKAQNKPLLIDFSAAPA